MGRYLPWKRRASKLEVVNGECSKTIMDIGGRNSKILMGNVIAFFCLLMTSLGFGTVERVSYFQDRFKG